MFSRVGDKSNFEKSHGKPPGATRATPTPNFPKIQIPMQVPRVVKKGHAPFLRFHRDLHVYLDFGRIGGVARVAPGGFPWSFPNCSSSIRNNNLLRGGAPAAPARPRTRARSETMTRQAQSRQKQNNWRIFKELMVRYYTYYWMFLNMEWILFRR